VTETVNVLSTLYSSINADTIELVTQIFDTLNEMTSGNQATRAEVINCKIMDYVNVILRAGTYEDCEPEQVSLAFTPVTTVCQGNQDTCPRYFCRGSMPPTLDKFHAHQ